MADDNLIATILAMLARPPGTVLAEIEALAARNPLLATKILAFRTFIAGLYEAMPGKALAGFSEISNLIKTGSGPVAPDIGDTA